MAIQRIGNWERSKLNTEQKMALVLFLILSTGGIFFGFRSFGANIYRPIQLQFAKFYTGEDVVNPDSAEAKQMAALKLKDTDGDGLSDYDETYVYKTNPYLKDSDSDGIDDKTEVMGGTDPNCPTGKVCNTATGAPTDAGTNTSEAVASDTSSVTAGLVGLTTDPTAILDSGKIQFKTKADVEAYANSITVKQIRDMLLQSGQIKKVDLDKISDQDLQQIYKDAVGQTSASGAMDSLVQSSGIVPSTSSPVVADSTQTIPAQPASTNPSTP